MIGSRKLSKIVKTLAVAISFTMLTGCAGIGPYSSTRLSMDTIGPGGENSRYLVRRTGDDGYPYTGIAKLEVSTGEDEELFHVENSASDRINRLYVEGDVACFIVDAVKSSPEYSLYLMNIQDGTSQKIYESDQDLSLSVIDGEKALFEGNDSKYKLDITTGELEPAPLEEGDIQIRSVYEEKTEAKYTLTSGEQVIIETAFGDPKITCTVEGKEYTLDRISTDEYKNAAIDTSYMSDKDGVLYGVLTIPKWQLSEREMKVSPSSMAMSDVKEEVFFSFDTRTGENKILYEGGGRIVGYNEHYIYLLEGQKVIRMHLEKKQRAKLGRIGSYRDTGDLIVTWVDHYLVFYDLHTGEIIGRLR